MKAVVVREFGPPEVMGVETVDAPSPGPGQVLIRVGAAGVNPVDTYIRSGTYARKPALPYTPGMDVGGRVEAIGEGVSRVRPGSRVYAYGVAGGYAELAIAPETHVELLPDDVTFQQGAAIGVPYGTAWRALLIRAGARPGETILVHGASGGVGIAAVQIARAFGMRVIGTAGTEDGMSLVRSQGAHDVLNHRDPDYLQNLLPLTGGTGVDVVLEMAAHLNLDRDLEVIAPRARIVIIGNRGRIEIDPRKAMAKDAAILGMMVFNADAAELRQIHAGLAAALESGALRPVIGRELPLADAATAHVEVLDRGAGGAAGKIVLIP